VIDFLDIINRPDLFVRIFRKQRRWIMSTNLITVLIIYIHDHRRKLPELLFRYSISVGLNKLVCHYNTISFAGVDSRLNRRG
jgi:hypothetical protein